MMPAMVLNRREVTVDVMASESVQKISKSTHVKKTQAHIMRKITELY